MADGGFTSTGVRGDVLSDSQRQMLRDNLDRSVVKSRTQAGVKLDYVEGWHAIKEANRIFGAGAWDRQLVRLEETNRDQVEITKNNNRYKQWRVGYLAVVRVVVFGEEGGSRVREGTGFGSGNSKNLGDAIEGAIKEAETDAMKRALITFGNPFGLALYDKSRAEVGKSSTVSDEEPQCIPEASREIEAQDKANKARATADKMIEEYKAVRDVSSLAVVDGKYEAHLRALKERYPDLYAEVKKVADWVQEAVFEDTPEVAAE